MPFHNNEESELDPGGTAIANQLANINFYNTAQTINSHSTNDQID
jgi:hypothetical protein